MRWDSRRPVPWRRLFNEWLVIGLVVLIVSWVFLKNHNAGTVVSVLLAGFVYVGFGAILAKLGYARKTLKQARAEAASRQARTAGAPSGAAARPRPAPTRRTSTGPSNRPNRKKR
jgi:hypothetical protein